MNSSDHNPAVRTDLSPQDSWELATPQMMKYYVKGGKYSNGKHGFIVSNANWDPYPLANKLESFVTALANMDIAVSLRIDRFSNPFFTGAKAAEVLQVKPEDRASLYLAGGADSRPWICNRKSPVSPTPWPPRARPLSVPWRICRRRPVSRRTGRVRRSARRSTCWT